MSLQRQQPGSFFYHSMQSAVAAIFADESDAFRVVYNAVLQNDTSAFGRDQDADVYARVEHYIRSMSLRKTFWSMIRGTYGDKPATVSDLLQQAYAGANSDTTIECYGLIDAGFHVLLTQTPPLESDLDGAWFHEDKDTEDARTIKKTALLVEFAPSLCTFSAVPFADIVPSMLLLIVRLFEYPGSVGEAYKAAFFNKGFLAALSAPFEDAKDEFCATYLERIFSMFSKPTELKRVFVYLKHVPESIAMNNLPLTAAVLVSHLMPKNAVMDVAPLREILMSGDAKNAAQLVLCDWLGIPVAKRTHKRARVFSSSSDEDGEEEEEEEEEEEDSEDQYDDDEAEEDDDDGSSVKDDDM